MQVKNQKRCTIHSNLDGFIHLLDSLGADIIRYQQGEGKRLQTTNLTKEMKLTTKYEIIEMTDLKAKRFSFLPTLEKRNEIHIFALNKIIKHGEVQ